MDCQVFCYNKYAGSDLMYVYYGATLAHLAPPTLELPNLAGASLNAGLMHHRPTLQNDLLWIWHVDSALRVRHEEDYRRFWSS